MFEVQKHTSLEMAIADGKTVKEVLDWKVQDATEKGLPIEATIADYIALAIDNTDEAIKKLEAYKKEITEAIAVLKSNQALTKADVYDWLKGNGIESLKGVCVSSISLKDEGVSITNKVIIDVTNEELLERNLAHNEEIIKPIARTIRINKRKVKYEEQQQSIINS